MKAKKIKKELRSKVEETLKITFSEFSEGLKTSQFRKNVRKASKALLAGLKVQPGKNKKAKTGKTDQVSLLNEQPA